MKSRRRGGIRSKTVAQSRMLRGELALGAALYPDRGQWRPTRRADCLEGGLNAARPCPFVGCQHHLYLDVSDRGSIKYNHPELQPEDLVECCALDVADRGGETLEEAGRLLNVTRERLRQIELGALEQLAAYVDLKDLLRRDHEQDYYGVRRTEEMWIEPVEDQPDERPIIDRSADRDLLERVWSSSSPITGARVEAWIMAHPWSTLDAAARGCGVSRDKARMAYQRSPGYQYRIDGTRYATVSMSHYARAVDLVVERGPLQCGVVVQQSGLRGHAKAFIRRHLDAVCLDRQSGLYVDPRRLG